MTKNDIDYIPLNETAETYPTSDIIEASILFTEGFELITTERHGYNGRATFVFKKKEGMSLFTNDYKNKKVLVEPIEFMSSIRHLKSLIR